MIYSALLFVVLAIFAALLGFGVIAVAFAALAKVLFAVFVVLFLISLAVHLGRRV